MKRKRFMMVLVIVAARGLAVGQISDVLDGDDGWIKVNNAQFVESANELLFPTAGTSFMFHSIGANWAGSAVYKDLGMTIQEGLYVIRFDAGHDGSSRPFAGLTRVNIGFFDASLDAPASHAEVRDSIGDFFDLDGVSRVSVINPIPDGGWERWQVGIRVEAGSPAIGTDVLFALHAQSHNQGGVQAAFDNLSIVHYPGGIVAGFGSVSTPSATGFRARAEQAYPLRQDQAGGDVFTAGAQISITGTMTLVGDNNNRLNDKVGVAIGNANDLGSFSTAGTSAQESYALYASTTTTWPGPNERYNLSKAGVDQVINQTVEAVPQGGTVDFALNLLFPDTFNNGEDGAHVYEYELGFDYNQDGFYEVIESGTFSAYEHDRIRFGFLVTKGAEEEAALLTNDYSYSIQRGFVEMLKPLRPAVVGGIAVDIENGSQVIAIDFDGEEDFIYGLQFREDLTTGEWEDVTPVVTNEQGFLVHTNSGPQGFYRIWTQRAD